MGQPKFITWTGGFSWAIPVGAKNVEASWDFIKWMKSEEATRLMHSVQIKANRKKGRIYVPWINANSRIAGQMFKEFAPKNLKFANAQRVFLRLLPVSRYRPVTFVGQQLWDSHEIAFEEAIFHKQSPHDALREQTVVVQRELDKVFTRTRYKLLNWFYPCAVVAILLAGGICFCAKKLNKCGPMGRLSKGEAAAGLFFASPWVIGFLVFTLGPIIASFIFSFCDYDVLHPARWVGLANYNGLLTDDWKYMGKAMYNAGYLALFGLPLGMVVSLSIAMLLNTNVRGMRYYRTIYYLPSIMPVVANAILWLWLLNPDYGIINEIWRFTLTAWLHVPPPLWLASESTSKPALIVMGLWARAEA